MGASIGNGGKKQKVTPQMNVTPLVDVVLVLLIIFMVVTPLLTKQFWINVPKKQEDVQQQKPDDDEPPLVLSLAADGKLRINKDEIRSEDLGARLPRMFAARNEAVLVFDAEDGASYGEAVRVLDLARAAGAVTIAVSPRELK